MSSCESKTGTLTSNMEALERELTPILAQLMTLSPDNNHHPDILWLYEWLSQSERTVEEFSYVIGPLQENVCQVMNQFFEYCIYGWGDETDIIYVLRVAAEALAVHCPVLEGTWTKIAWNIFETPDRLNFYDYGQPSLSLSFWMIRVIGDPYMCPDTQLRVHMLSLIRDFVELDGVEDYRNQALAAFMMACSTPDRHGESFFLIMYTTDTDDLLMLFNEQTSMDDVNDDIDCTYYFGSRIAEKLSHYRKMRHQTLMYDISHKYAMGLKLIAEPCEVQIISGLMKHIIVIAHEAKEEINYIEKIRLFKKASQSIQSLIRVFKKALQDPMLLSITTESIMYVMEAVVVWGIDKYNSGNFDSYYDCFIDIDELFVVLLDGDFVDESPIVQEIINRYKGRICNMRSQVCKSILLNYDTIFSIIYNNKH